MVKSESSKCGEASKGSSGGIDRISNLPDPLISQILSLLPTKSAVATSVLSTRWKFRWTSINNLDFSNHVEAGYLSEKERDMKRNKFTHFVNRVLLLCNPPSIQNFHLTLNQALSDFSCINSWISEAFGRTVQKLDLVLRLEHPIELPLSHVGCNVVVLKLEGSIYFNIPASTSVCFPSLQTLHLDEITFTIPSNSSVSFPNLKSLYLNIARYTNEESVLNLFSSCPVLDDLVIVRMNSVDIDCLVIQIPSLTSLKLYVWCGNDYPYKFQIDTPALQYLDIEEDELPCEYFIAENLSSLLQAKLKLNLHDEDGVYGERCASIFKCMGSNSSTVKFLSASGQILKAIIAASSNISPSFHNLTRLELDDDGDCLELSGVINFLESMDNLEHLVMKGWSCKHSHQSWWTEPLNVPKCLLSRVITISFNYATVDCCDQLELLRYFLKNSKVLQVLTISRGVRSGQQLQLLQKISMYPRGSGTCQVKLESCFLSQFKSGTRA